MVTSGATRGRWLISFTTTSQTADADAEAFYDAEVREAHATRLELQSQLRSKTLIIDFRMDVKAIAAQCGTA